MKHKGEKDIFLDIIKKARQKVRVFQNLISPYNLTPKSPPLLAHENKINNHQLKKLLIVRQILLVSTLANVWKL